MKEVSVQEALKRKYPEWIVMLTVKAPNNKVNIITLGWFMCTSFNPPMIAISIGHNRFSHDLVLEHKEFGVNFVAPHMKEDMLFCGTHSGREYDKFACVKLEPFPSKIISTPLIKDAPMALECVLDGYLKTGDHTIFSGKIVNAWIDEKCNSKLYTISPNKFKEIKFYNL